MTATIARCSCSFVVGLGALNAASARAEVPLVVEDMLTKKGKWRFETSLTLSNADRSGISGGDTSYVDVGGGLLIPIQSPTTSTRSDETAAVAQVGLRYGVNERTELSIRGSGVYSSVEYEYSGGGEE